jgi:hypothetical protein
MPSEPDGNFRNRYLRTTARARIKGVAGTARGDETLLCRAGSPNRDIPVAENLGFGVPQLLSLPARISWGPMLLPQACSND